MIYYLYIYTYLNIHIIVISACSPSYYHENWIKTVEFKSARHPPGTPTQPGGRDLRSHRVHPVASSSSSPGLGNFKLDGDQLQQTPGNIPKTFNKYLWMTLGEHPKLQEIKNMSGLSHSSNWKHVSSCPHARFVALRLPHKHHIERERKKERERIPSA